jgi:hypothetical protein
VLLLRITPRLRRRLRPALTWPQVAMPDVYRVMGGTDGRGWFGNDALGGRQTSPLVTTFSPVIPAGYGLVVFQALYNYTPSDASLLALAGASNTLTLTPGAQRAHDAAGSNDGSVTFYHSGPLASSCSSCTYDMTGLPAGDDGRYGQMVFFVVRYPDTVNGFFTGTPVTNTQTTTTSVDPGTITLPTNKTLELFGWTNRGHTEDLLPLSISPAVFPVDLQHSKLHVVTDSPTDFGSVHNSITQSGSVMGYVNEAGGTHTPSVTFTGSSPTTAAAHSVLVAYNILGGSPVAAGVPFNLALLGVGR